MELRTVDENFAVAPQVQPEDMAALAEQGFTTVMCNRPDGEEPGQPALSDIRAAAEAAGLDFYHVPVAGGMFPPEQLTEFARIRKEAEGKVLAYCRSGTRSITMDTLSNPMGMGVDERIERAAKAGYDLSPLRGHLQDQ